MIRCNIKIKVLTRDSCSSMITLNVPYMHRYVCVSRIQYAIDILPNLIIIICSCTHCNNEESSTTACKNPYNAVHVLIIPSPIHHHNHKKIKGQWYITQNCWETMMWFMEYPSNLYMIHPANNMSVNRCSAAQAQVKAITALALPIF